MVGFDIKKVVEVDSTDNDSYRDVIGNKEDKSFSDIANHGSSPSIIGHLTAGYYHVHDAAKLYPKLADAVPINNEAASIAAGAWTEGDKQTIIPASTLTKNFDIHWIKIFSISDNDEYVLTLYNGDTEIGCVGFAKVNNFISHVDCIIQVPPQPANSEIKATLAAKAGTSTRTVTLKIFYHEYPDMTV